MNFDNRGIVVPDISFYQDVDTTERGVDFQTMKAAGASGVIIRAGQNTWKDPDFQINWLRAKQAGLPRGSYWYFDSRAEPGNQAAVWRGLIDGDYPELGLWADFEERYNGAWSGENSWMTFLEAVKMRFPGVLLGVYSANWWWHDQVVKNPSYFENYPLWVAQYASNPAFVDPPFPWRNKGAVLWQFTDKGDGPKYGTESLNVDLSFWNGDLQSFKDYFKLSGDVIVEPPAPPIGDTMLYGTVVATTTLNIRSGPGASYLDIGDLHFGDKLVASENIGGWWKLVSINNVPVALTETYAMSNAGMWIRQDQAPVPTPDVSIPDYLVAHFQDGTQRKYLPE